MADPSASSPPPHPQALPPPPPPPLSYGQLQGLSLQPLTPSSLSRRASLEPRRPSYNSYKSITSTNAPPSPLPAQLSVDLSSSRTASIRSLAAESSFDHGSLRRATSSTAPDSPYYLSAASSFVDPHDRDTRRTSPASQYSSLFSSSSTSLVGKHQGGNSHVQSSSPTIPKDPKLRPSRSSIGQQGRPSAPADASDSLPTHPQSSPQSPHPPSAFLSTGQQGRAQRMMRKLSQQNLKDVDEDVKSNGLLRPLSRMGRRRPSVVSPRDGEEADAGELEGHRPSQADPLSSNRSSVNEDTASRTEVIRAKLFGRRKKDKVTRLEGSSPAQMGPYVSPEEANRNSRLFEFESSPAPSSSSSQRWQPSITDAQTTTSSHLTPASSVAAAHPSANSLGDNMSTKTGKAPLDRVTMPSLQENPSTLDPSGSPMQRAGTDNTFRANAVAGDRTPKEDFETGAQGDWRGSAHGVSDKQTKRLLDRPKTADAHINVERAENVIKTSSSLPHTSPNADPLQSLIRHPRRTIADQGEIVSTDDDASPLVDSSEANLARATVDLKGVFGQSPVRSLSDRQKRSSKTRRRAGTATSSSSRNSWIEPMARSSSLQSPERGSFRAGRYVPSPPPRSSSSSFVYYDAGGAASPGDVNLTRPGLSGWPSGSGRLSSNLEAMSDRLEGLQSSRGIPVVEVKHRSRSTSRASLDARSDFPRTAASDSHVSSPIGNRASSITSKQSFYVDADQSLDRSASGASRRSHLSRQILVNEHPERSEPPSLPRKSPLRPLSMQPTKSDPAVPTLKAFATTQAHSPRTSSIAPSQIPTSAESASAENPPIRIGTPKSQRNSLVYETSPARSSIEEAFLVGGGAWSLPSNGSHMDNRASPSDPTSGADAEAHPSVAQGLSEAFTLPSDTTDEQTKFLSGDYVPPVRRSIENTGDSTLSFTSPSYLSKHKTLRKVTPPIFVGAFKSRKSPGGSKDVYGASVELSTGTIKSKRWGFSDNHGPASEGDVARSRLPDLSRRKKSKDAAPRPEIRRVFDPREQQHNGLDYDHDEGDDLQNLPGEDQWGRRRATSAGNSVTFGDSAPPTPLPEQVGNPTETAPPLVSPKTINAPGLSWTASALDSEGKRLYRRRNVIRELVDTERSYASDLGVIRDIYLAKARSLAGLPSPGPWSALSTASNITSPAYSISSATGGSARIPTTRCSSTFLGRLVVSGGSSAMMTPPLQSEARMRSVSANSAATLPSPASGSASNRSSIMTSDSKSGSRHGVEHAPSSSSSLQSNPQGAGEEETKANVVEYIEGEDSFPLTGAETSTSVRLLPQTPPMARDVAPAARTMSSSKTIAATSAGLLSKPVVAIDTRASLTTGLLTPSSAGSDAPLSSADIRVIFAGVDQTVAFAEEMSFTLSAAMGTLAASALPADPSTLSDSCDDFIGRCFCESADRIHSVFASYCSRHESAIARLQELSSTSSKAASFLKDCTELARRSTNAWDLASLLIKPVQRMLKYPLLLQEILSCTPPSHPDYEDLRTAIDQMQKVADSINELSRRRDIINSIVGGQTTSAGVNSAKPRSASKSPTTKSYKRPALLRKQKSKVKDLSNGTTSSTSLSQGDATPALLQDEDNYASLVAMVKSLEEGIDALQRRMLRWSSYAKHGYAQQILLLKQWATVYGLAAAEAEIELDAAPERMTSIKAMLTLLHQTSEQSSARLDAAIHSELLPALSKIRKVFEGPRAYMTKRDERQLDYARYKAAVSSSGKDAKAIINDRKLVESANGFVALHSQLLDELPYFIQGIEAALEPVIAAFAQVQTDYHKQMLDLLQNFAAKNRLRQGVSSSLDGPITEEGEMIAPALTALGSRQIAHYWWNSQRPVAETIEELTICNFEGTRFDGLTKMQPSQSDTGPLRSGEQGGSKHRTRNFSTSDARVRSSHSPSMMDSSQSSLSTADAALPVPLGEPHSRGPSDGTSDSTMLSVNSTHGSIAGSVKAQAGGRSALNMRNGSSTAGNILRSISGTFRAVSTSHAGTNDFDLDSLVQESHTRQGQGSQVENRSSAEDRATGGHAPFVLPTLDLGEHDLSPVSSPHLHEIKLDAEPKALQG